MWSAVLVSAAIASNYNSHQPDASADQGYFVNVALDGGASDIDQTSCDTATGETTTWGNISANAGDLTAYGITRAAAVAAGSTLGLGKHCSTEYCAAYATGTNAGRWCAAKGCALAAHGDWSGAQCIGENCSAWATSGCVTSVWGASGAQSCSDAHGHCIDVGDDDLDLSISSGDFDSCCVGHQGSGCLQEGCAQFCVGKHCGEHCIGAHCGRGCRGYECASYCQSSHKTKGCAKECVGVECGENCLGAYCAQGCNGTQCGQSCEGNYCAKDCVSTLSTTTPGSLCGQFCLGTGCAQGCTGPRCGRNCMGDYCAKDCKKVAHPTNDSTAGDHDGCGQYAVGYQSAAFCQGHACGEGCHGIECAAYGARSVPPSVLCPFWFAN